MTQEAAPTGPIKASTVLQLHDGSNTLAYRPRAPPSLVETDASINTKLPPTLLTMDVTELPYLVINEDVKKHALVSIPGEVDVDTVFDRNGAGHILRVKANAGGVRHTVQASRTHAKIIKNWIFTPTHYDNAYTFDKSRLDRSACYTVRSSSSRSAPNKLKPFYDYIEVLVIKAADYDRFAQHFRHTHMILVLPETFAVDADKLDSAMSPTLKPLRGATRRRLHGKQFTAAKSGIGYSRLYIQLLCYHWHLDAAWVLDSGITDTLELRPEVQCESVLTEVGTKRTAMDIAHKFDKHELAYRVVTFAEIMLDLQGIYYGADTSITVCEAMAVEDKPEYMRGVTDGNNSDSSTRQEQQQNVKRVVTEARYTIADLCIRDADEHRYEPCPKEDTFKLHDGMLHTANAVAGAPDVTYRPLLARPTVVAAHRAKTEQNITQMTTSTDSNVAFEDVWDDDATVRTLCGDAEKHFAMISIHRGYWRLLKEPFTKSNPYSFILLNATLTVKVRITHTTYIYTRLVSTLFIVFSYAHVL
jgi:hypothetical protein